ncbi:MAG: DinB family protein [Saprospiraceae bacterium]|nr:DinB family protein [Saprospiraceae bacterium]
MDIVQQLTKCKDETLPYFQLGIKDLEKTYQAGKWSIKKILVHLADAESVLHERIKRVISEPKVVVWAFDQDKWSENLNYVDFPIDIGRQMFEANRNSIIYLAQSYYHSKGDSTFVHSEAGLRTLKDEFDKVVLHNKSHLNQILAALNQ